MKWLLIGLVLGLVACGDDDGGTQVDASDDDAGGEDASLRDAADTDAGGDAGPISCGPLTGRTPGCDTCLRANCCFELAACGSDLTCPDLVACLRTCDDADASNDCTATCVGTHGLSSAYNPLVLCGAGACAAECPFASP